MENVQQVHKRTETDNDRRTVIHWSGHSPVWNDVRSIYRENNWKKRKFKEPARITSHNKEQLMSKKD